MTDAHPIPDRDRADFLVRQGRHAEAVTLYRRLTEQFPDEASHLLALAWALHDSGRPEEAAVCFERLFEKELTKRLFAGFAYDELVRIYRDGHNLTGLISVCERAVLAQPDDTCLLETLGEAYLTVDRAADAAQVFEKLISLEPDAPVNWCALGNARLAAGDMEGAEAAYLKAAEIDPEEAPVVFSRLAGACLALDHPDHAQAAIERSLAAKPDEPRYLLELGDILVHRGDPEGAADVYSRAASLGPDAGACWYRLGNHLTKKGLHVLATEAFGKAVAAEPDNGRYLLGLAASYAARGLTDRAAATLRRAKSLIGTSSGR